MPNVDVEWAKFEREVISKEDASHKRMMLWGLSIAASIALVAGIFLFGKDTLEQTEVMVAKTEQPAVPSSYETATIAPENKTEQPTNTDLLAMATPSETKKEEAPGNHPAVEENVRQQETVFDCLEESPRFPGGNKALLEFIEANKQYTGLAQEYGAKGRVATSFLIDSLGYISDIKVHRCLLKYDTLRLSRETEEMQQQVKQQIENQLGEESMRIVSLMPQWIPGKINGKVRNVRYTIRFQFP